MAYNPSYINFDINPFDEQAAITGLQGDLDALLADYASETDVSAIESVFPIITDQPTDYTGAIGETATFHVAVVGLGTLSYQWQYRAPGGSTWSNISSGTSDTFAREITSARNGQSLRCKITDAGNARTVYSEAGTIHVG